MKEKRYVILMIVCLVFLWLVGEPLYGQDVIRRQGKVAKTTSPKGHRPQSQINSKQVAAPKKSKHRSQKQPERPMKSRHSLMDYDDVVVDSIAIDDIEADSTAIAEENSPKSVLMASGFEMYGRVEKKYVDNAITQKSLRESLRSCQNAKTGCLTNEKAMYVYGGNGYSSNGISSEMLETLKYCNVNRYTITDVAFNDNGLWCVVYEGNKFKGNMPEGCKKALDSYISQNDAILSVSFSGNGNYAIVTESHFNASDTFDYNKMQQAVERFGHINSVCITNRGIIVACSRGILFWDVPENVINSLKTKNITPRVVRYTDSGTYMAFDVSGAKAYYM